MLKAALSEKNRSLEKQEVYAGARARSRDDYVRARLLQQAAQLKSQQRKRASKNNVLFCDPLVTKKYEYEQTTVPDVLSSDSSSMSTLSSDSSDSDSRESNEFCRKPLFHPRRRRFRQARSYLAISANKINEQLLRTSLSDDKLEYGTYTTLSPDKNLRKRPHELVDDSDEETKTIPIGSERGSKKSEGSLFSSPKVAKIAPYQDDKTDHHNEGDMSTVATNPFPAATGQGSHSAQRSSYSQRIQAQIQLKLANNNNNMFNSNNNTSSKLPATKKASQFSQLAEIESGNPVSELISYKPVRSSDFEDSCKDEVVADNGQSEVGYFGWLTSKISYLSQNVFNRIIY